MAKQAPFMRQIRRWRRTQTERMAGPRSRHVRGTIDHITSGKAFVTIGADTIPAPYYAHYTPVAGDFVDVRLDDGSPIILGKITGLPDF